MLKTRLLTSGVAGLGVIAILLWLPALFIVALFTVALLFVAWEWARLAGLADPTEAGLYALTCALLSLIPAGVLAPGLGLALAWLALVAFTWLVVTLWLVLGAQPRTSAHGRRWGWLLLGLLLVPALTGSLCWLVFAADFPRGIVLYAVALVWAADSGAYFVGRAWGRHKLAPGISAGKTWEGVAGGLTGVAIFALIGGVLIGLPATRLPLWVALSVAAGALSIVGDLLESVLKREAGVKDSGNLLPGHGGLLDRTDSVMAALPIMALGLAWFPGVGT